MCINRRYFLFFLLVTYILSILSCNTDGLAGGAETTNGIIVAVAGNRMSGTAPAGSQVVVCDTSYLPYDSFGFICSTFADTDGKFMLDSLPDGVYNVIGRNGTLDSGAIIRDVDVKSENMSELSEKCKYGRLGAIAGTAYVNSMGVESGWVFIAGTDLNDRTDDLGGYDIDGIPEGNFTVTGYYSEGKRAPISNQWYLKLDVEITGNNTNVRVDLNLEEIN